MPNTNDIEYKYSRVYRYIKPNSTDPGTWRLSVPETGIGTGGGGGTGGVPHDIDGTLPIVAATSGSNPRRTNISLNIQALPDRVAI